MPTPKKENTVADLKLEVTELRGALNLVNEDKRASDRAAEAAEKRVADAKVLIASLQEKVAELNGYIRRTHEIDDSRSEMVPVEAPDEMPRTKLARSPRDVPGSDRPWRSTPRLDEKGWSEHARPHWTAL